MYRFCLSGLRATAAAAALLVAGLRAEAQAPPPAAPAPAPPPAGPPPPLGRLASDDIDRRFREQQAEIEDIRAAQRRLEQELEVAKKAPAGGMISIAGDRVQLGGLLRLEYVDTQDETQSAAGTTENPAGRFRLNRFRLSPHVTLRKDLLLDAQIDVRGTTNTSLGETQVLVKQAWVTFRDLPVESVWLEAGLRQRFVKPDRKTDTVPLVGRAFWSDDDLGFTLGGDPGPVYWRAGVYNGLKMDDGPIGKDDSFYMLRDERTTADTSTRKEVAAGLGTVWSDERLGRFDLLGFAYADALSNAEIRVLRGVATYGTSDGAAQHRFGANLDWTLGGADVFVEVLQASDGRLRRTGGYVQPSYKLPLPEWTRAESLTVLYRYDRLDNNLDPVITDSRTWDRQRHTAAFLIGVVRDVTVRLEYNLNDETTGGRSVHNDEFLAQLEVRF